MTQEPWTLRRVLLVVALVCGATSYGLMLHYPPPGMNVEAISTVGLVPPIALLALVAFSGSRLKSALYGCLVGGAAGWGFRLFYQIDAGDSWRIISLSFVVLVPAVLGFVTVFVAERKGADIKVGLDRASLDPHRYMYCDGSSVRPRRHNLRDHASARCAGCRLDWGRTGWSNRLLETKSK